MKQEKNRDAFPQSSATINQAIGATPSRKAKKRAAKAERGIEREALAEMGIDDQCLYWGGLLDDIGNK